MNPKYLQIGLISLTLVTAPSAFAATKSTQKAQAKAEAAAAKEEKEIAAETTMLPPPPPVLNPSFQRQLRKPLSKEERASRVEAQKEIDKAMVPLAPEQIARTQVQALENEKQLNFRSEPRKPRDRDVFWSVGSVGETIRMAPGYTTTILFFNAQGQPVQVADPGAIVGDEEAIEPNASGNAVVLYVKKPWRSTNLTVFLKNVPVPVQFTLSSERDPAGTDVDYQVRTRIMDGAAVNLERKDTFNMNALLQLTNGLSGGNLVVLPVVSVEKGDPTNKLNWSQIQNNIAQFRVGPEGYTYVILKPGFKMVYPNVPNVLAALTGADGTQGYIVAGNNPRMFTVQDANGAMYRITVQR